MVYITYNKAVIEYTYNTVCFEFQNKNNKRIEPVYSFIKSIENKKFRAKVLQTINLLRDNGYFLRMPYNRYLYDGIYELRIIQGGNIARILYFYDENQIVLTNGFIKKSQKTPQKQIETAIKYRTLYYCQKEGGYKNGKIQDV